MRINKTYHAEPGTLPYRYTNGEALENIAQPTPRPLYSVSSMSPVHSPPWHIPSETGSVPDTSTSGSQNTEQPAYSNLPYDFSRQADYSYGRESLPPYRGYDARTLERPPVPPSVSSQITSQRSMMGKFLPRTTAHPILYTDDAGLKLCDRVRRQCFNCRATATTTWRRSILHPGKLVCNKCGLFERTHAVPRPKTFPRRRRSPRSSGHPNMELPPFNHLELRHNHDRQSVEPFAGHFPSGFATMEGETNSQDTTWMRDNVSLTPPRLSTAYTVSPQPMTYRADFHFPSTIPAEAASLPSHLDDYRFSS